MDDLLVVLLLAAPIAAVVAFIFLKKRRNRAARTASTCGTKPHRGGTVVPSAWHIGPDLSGRGKGSAWTNKSPGMRPHPDAHPEGFSIDFPTAAGSKVDYVTFNHGPLTGKRQIRMRYRLELDPGVQVLAVPETDPNIVMRAQMTPVIIREGDDWTTAGAYEAYRWYNIAYRYLEPGEHEMIVPLDSGWTATQVSTMASNPTGFKDAIDHACCVGFVFGGNEIGIGHGARATGRARMVVTAFEVE
jgi:hypothetical protein